MNETLLARAGSAAAEQFRASLEGRWQRIGGAEIAIDRPVDFYENDAYGAIVYGRAALFFVALEEELGRDRMAAFIRDIVVTYRWDYWTTADFAELLRDHADFDVEPFLAEWGVK